MNNSHIGFGIAGTLAFLASGCVTSEPTMETHGTPMLTAWAILLVIVLAVGGCLVAGGIIFAAFRRGGPVAGSLVTVLLGMAAVGACLMLGYLLVDRREAHVQVELQDQRRAETRAIEAEYLRNRLESRHPRDLQPAMPLPPPVMTPGMPPIEAPRPLSLPSSDDGPVHALPAESITSESLPEWVSAGTIDEGDGKLVVVRGQQFADSDRAERDALSRVIAEVAADFMHDHRPWGTFVLYPEHVREIAVRHSHTETIERTAGENAFTVYRTYLQVELSDESRRQVEAIWKEQASMQRSVAVAGVLALLTAIAGVFSGYFRLDDRTQGRYRWRLRFGALAATVLIGGTLFAGTRIASNAVRPSPVQTPSTSVDLPVVPSEARMPQIEASVDDQDQERFREVADRMVAAINAADYEGVRQDFNQTMLDTFPVEKCRAFFGEKISDKYGTINELEPPHFTDTAAVFLARCERGTLNFILVLDEQGQVAGLLLRPRTDLPVSEMNQARRAPDCPIESMLSSMECWD
ncbi:MAG: DUF3887 domain-containing protein [Planctomycetaceae bacterium]